MKQAAHGNGETTNHRLLMVHVKDEFLAARGDRATSKQAGEVVGGSTRLHYDQRLLQDDPKEGKELHGVLTADISLSCHYTVSSILIATH